MGLTVPKDLVNVLAEADRSQLSIDVMELAGKLVAAIKEPKALTIEEQRGAFAEVDEEILAHWISRSEHAKHPVLRARFADIA